MINFYTASMNKINTLFLVLLSIVLGSCDVTDSIKNCTYETSIKLQFEYLPESNSGNKIGTFLKEDARLFIYNEDGSLYSDYLVSPDELLSQYFISLPSGNFTLVCWGNPGDNTEINGAPFLDGASVSAKGYTANEDLHTNDKLYFARMDLVVPEFNNTSSKLIEETVKFKSSSVLFEVIAKNFESKDLFVTIDNLTPQYDFNMSPKPYNAIYYLNRANMSDLSVISFKGNTFRFNNNNNIHINLYEKELNGNTKLLKSQELKSLLQSENINAELTSELNLYVEFVATSYGISVSVKEWKSVEIIPGA